MLKHGGSYVLVAGEGDAMMSNLRCWLFVPVAMLLMTVSGALRAHEQTTPLAASGAQSGEYLFTGWDGPSLPVFYQLPDRVAADTPVVFVMHGVNRDADRYRDEWADLARRHAFIAVFPQFGNADFPGSLGYNTGYFTTQDGAPRPRTRWSFAAIEPLFEDLRTRFGTRVGRYSIYGHSAGAQFVHRYVLFMPEARIDRAVAANAGWYTMPDRTVTFPYGLGSTPVGEAGLSAALGKPLTVLLGTADTDRADTDLRKTPEADAQGPHRYARSQAFFAQGQRAAESAGVPFGWSLERVPGIGHSNAGMAEAAAALIAKR
jgi:poly(3-hydroxybutyrate) depolymerase